MTGADAKVASLNATCQQLDSSRLAMEKEFKDADRKASLLEAQLERLQKESRLELTDAESMALSLTIRIIGGVHTQSSFSNTVSPTFSLIVLSCECRNICRTGERTP